MVRLKYDEKPIDPQLSVSQKLDGWNPESDVVWMTWDEWFANGIPVDELLNDVPDEIKQFIVRDPNVGGCAGETFWIRSPRFLKFI